MHSEKEEIISLDKDDSTSDSQISSSSSSNWQEEIIPNRSTKEIRRRFFKESVCLRKFPENQFYFNTSPHPDHGLNLDMSTSPYNNMESCNEQEENINSITSNPKSNTGKKTFHSMKFGGIFFQELKHKYSSLFRNAKLSDTYKRTPSLQDQESNITEVQNISNCCYPESEMNIFNNYTTSGPFLKSPKYVRDRQKAGAFFKNKECYKRASRSVCANRSPHCKKCIFTKKNTRVIDPIVIIEELRQAIQDRKDIHYTMWYGSHSICQPTVRCWVGCLGYLIHDSIGIGPYSQVFTADDALGKFGQVAVKVIRIAPLCCHGLDKIFLKEQILRWCKLKHPNIVTLYDGVLGRRKVFYVMEYGCNGDLFHQLLDENHWIHLLPLMARKWTWQMTCGLNYLHEINIPHQNLKLENILIFCKENVKLSDIGLARILRDPCKSKKCCRLYIGTNAYIAPEVLRGEHSCSMAADMWSFGVILYALWNRCLPFPTDLSDRELADIHCAEQLQFKSADDDSFQVMVTQLIKSLLQICPEHRPSTGQLKTNCFFQKIKKRKKKN